MSESQMSESRRFKYETSGSDSGDYIKYEDHEARIALKDAEITRLNAALARVRGQRDESLLDLDSALNGRMLVSRVSEYIEREHRVRIIGEGKTRTVEEIES